MFGQQYVPALPQMRADLKEIGVEGTSLPDSAEEFKKQRFDAFMAGKRALEEDRTRLNSFSKEEQGNLINWRNAMADTAIQK